MIKALIFGCTGYTGIELTRILTAHPDVKIVGGSSRQHAGKQASQVFPFVHGAHDFPLRSLAELASAPDADVAFLGLPHGESAEAIRPLMDAGLKVIDLSADCRLHDSHVYEEWYGAHKDPEILPQAVYGLPEIHRDAIRTARLVANPGCYPTSVILATAPLFGIAEVDTSSIVVDSKSGVSGAGRGAKAGTSFCEIGEGFKPYNVSRHRHTPEMEQELSELHGAPVKVRFTPHLIPVSRGMVSTVYLRLVSEPDLDRILDAYRGFYQDEPFVRVLPKGQYPDTAFVRGSNLCLVAVEVDLRAGWLIAMSAIDNLTKGASGEAVQNMNLMTGLPETTGLMGLPVFP
ncbi:MAG: N-acetyl-gamma-glutamyl-phosphate reductase [Thermodesulfobacteriota bacterium]